MPAGPASGHKEYKLLTPRDKIFESRFDLSRLEEALNQFARQGWTRESHVRPARQGILRRCRRDDRGIARAVTSDTGGWPWPTKCSTNEVLDCVDPEPLRRARWSNAEDTTTDQVREALPLFRVQEGMDFLKRADERIPQLCRTLNPALAGASGLGGVKRVAGHCVGKLRECSAIIHLGLSSLGLDVVEDPDQSRDLLLVEVELVCKEPERPPDTKGRPALESIGVVMVVVHETPSALAPIAAGGAPKVLNLLQPFGTRKKGDVFETDSAFDSRHDT